VPRRSLLRFLEVDTEAINDSISRAILAVLPVAVVRGLATFFGIVAALSPLSIWVAWSAEMLFNVVMTGGISLVLCGMLSCAISPKTGTTDALGRPRRAKPFETTPKISRKRTWRDSA